eukprot:Blabericola_migrator_1__1769@NODE_1479_length_4459_cov_8_118625_g970_i0_p1_GENE_NODE_1479_length_4459_cov_8_118625_g970_i0NODE_1479_length_4459_cov_8_118625_g970_i0_p1_ORF_typecomplete_len230_score22_07_NODE_1479_length_4459_cov_8_118625_g970_i0110799
MRSVGGNPSKKLACQLELLTVLLCPAAFPTSPDVVHLLSATQEQATVSASGLADGVTESTSTWAETLSQGLQAGLDFFNTNTGSTTAFSTDLTADYTTQHLSEEGLTASDWISYSCGAISLAIIFMTASYAVYQSYAPTRPVVPPSFEPTLLPLSRVDVPSTQDTPAFLRPGGCSRPPTPPTILAIDDVKPSAPLLGPDSPPAYEGPPTHDGKWSTPNGQDAEKMPERP